MLSGISKKVHVFINTLCISLLIIMTLVSLLYNLKRIIGCLLEHKRIAYNR